MVCEGLVDRINHDYHRHGIQANRSRFANMVPPLFSPNHPAIQDRLRDRQHRMIGELERQGRYTPLHGYTVRERNPVTGRGAERLARDTGREVAREEARQQGQREGYVQAMNDYGAERDARSERYPMNEVGSETSMTQGAYERFMHHKERKEHYGREVENAHRRSERKIEDQRRRMSSPVDRRSTRSEFGGYREDVEYRRRVEDHRPNQDGRYDYEYERVHRPRPGARDTAGYAEREPYAPRASIGYERGEGPRRAGRHEHRSDYDAEERTPLRADLNPRRGRDEAQTPRRRDGFEDLRESPIYRRQPRGSLYEGRDDFDRSGPVGFDDYPRANPAAHRYSPSTSYDTPSAASSPPPTYHSRRYGRY